MSTDTRTGAGRARALLLMLALANFAVGMGAFSVIGILTPVAAGFGLDQAGAGWLMTVYALVYAVSSPLLVALTGERERVHVLTGGLLLLFTGAALAALAPGYTTLLAARALMAVGSGLVTPVATAIGVASVPLDQRGRALALVFGGITLAQALGVPSGAWLGYTIGWRVTFAIVAALALGSASVLFVRAPRGLRVPANSLATLGDVLRTPRSVLAIAFNALFVGGAFAFVTYLAPFVEARHGLGREGVFLMFLVFGVGAVVGNAIGGFLTDRIGPVRALIGLAIGQIAILPILTLTHVPVTATAALLGVSSLLGWSAQVPQQARLAALDPERTSVLLALNAAAIYLGGSIGSAAGGQTIAIAGYDALGVTGAALALLGLVSLAVVAALGKPGALPVPACESRA
ncbi:MFS transporter [Marinivivus vitaminiproducens]|uniref:MFS transporter n=1 Tax=Marinivivus vitaminiproducens TaxID=3035935 RepID=UPI0027A24F37|nr:MFS transporter [Geminicoccaceae bacterium SCSIO 64248]